MNKRSISDRELRRAAEQVGQSMLAELPPPSACDHAFSEQFETKMAPLLNEDFSEKKKESCPNSSRSDVLMDRTRKGRHFHMKKRTILILAAVIAVLLAGLAIAAANDVFPFFQLGKNMRERVDASDEKRIVAQYGDSAFTEKDVNLRLEMNRVTGGDMAEKDTEEEAVEQLAVGRMMLEEAEKRGLTATPEEISQFLAEQKRAYEESPEVKTYLDEYCAGAGMTIEAYWALLEQYAPETVTRQKLKGEILELYRAEHPDASEEDVSAAWDAYEKALLDQHRSEIVWTGK